MGQFLLISFSPLAFDLLLRKIFSAVVADALLWIPTKKGITMGLHYLDDFVRTSDRKQRGSTEAEAGYALHICESPGPNRTIKTRGSRHMPDLSGN